MAVELAYTLHLSSDKNKKPSSRKIAKDNPSGTTSQSKNSIQMAHDLSKIGDIPVNIQNIIEKEQRYIEKMENEISNMKKDSIALINQITTISKQRIFKDTIRGNVKISSESLDIIDKKITKYFTK